MRRFLLLILVPLFLAACTAEPTWAPDEQVKAAFYHHPGPPTITLFTAVNNRTNKGGHSGLMISGSQRVVFDPAGTWWHRTVPERNDVHYGFTPLMEKFYIDYHARETYRVVVQSVEVSPEVAELALQMVQQNGAVSKAMCANSTSSILRKLPGFTGIGQSYFPNRIMDDFAKLPGATMQVIYDNDSDNNQALLSSQQSGSY
ncbi:hypothetical protein [Actibacterium sp.]|uniref:hypothetical protein n=1 Tax=Actibacterium sp. TaxID=1872125 RepID=UPI0035653F7B